MRMNLPALILPEVGWSFASSFLKGIIGERYESQEKRAELSHSSIHGPQSSPFWARPSLILLAFVLFFLFLYISFSSLASTCPHPRY